MDYTTKKIKKENFLQVVIKIESDAKAKKIPIQTIAENFLNEHKIINDSNHQIYIYNNKFWEKISKETLGKLVGRYDNKWHSTISRRAETVGIILKETLNFDIPWNNIDKYDIAFENGIFNALTGEKKDFNPGYYLNNIVPFDLEENAPWPMQHVMDDWFDTEEKKLCLMEAVGYTLSNLNGSAFKTAFFLKGESDTGKSKVLELIGYALGEGNVSCIPINKYDDSRSLAPIEAKKANIVPEIATGAILAEDGFKKIVSGDRFEIDPKNVKPYCIVPLAKMWFASNNLFKVNDKSNAVWRRMIIINFNRVIPLDKQDSSLMEKLKSEENIKGFIAQAFKGFKRLIQQKGFTKIPDGIETVNQMRCDNNIVLDFLLNSGFVERTDDYANKVCTADLLTLFNYWSKKNTEIRWFLKQLRNSTDVIIKPSNCKYYAHKLKMLKTTDELEMMQKIANSYQGYKKQVDF